MTKTKEKVELLINCADEKTGDSSLYLAVEIGCRDVVGYLLSKGIVLANDECKLLMKSLFMERVVPPYRIASHRIVSYRIIIRSKCQYVQSPGHGANTHRMQAR